MFSTEPCLEYERALIRLGAGRKLALTFNNNDDMAHNVVVKLAESADAESMAAITFGLDADDPDTPGDYMFVYTFPGQYESMRGIIGVRRKLTYNPNSIKKYAFLSAFSR